MFTSNTVRTTNVTTNINNMYEFIAFNLTTHSTKKLPSGLCFHHTALYGTMLL